MLASALSINSMLFFLGGSFGTTLLIAVTAARGTPGSNPLNPFYSGAAAGFSDGFLILTLPVIAALALLLALTNVAEPSVAGPAMDAEPDAVESPGWTGDCSVPWTPQCVEFGETARPTNRLAQLRSQ